MSRRAVTVVFGRVLLLMAGCLALSGSALAHHGVANFDLNTEIEITGTVVEVALVNPHSWLHLDVRGADGRMTRWRCELRGASVLRRSGWTREMFPPGTRVTVTGAPDRFDPQTCYLGSAVFGDGTRIDRYGRIERGVSPSVARTDDRPLRLPNGDPNIAGDWAAEQRMLTDPRGMSGAFLPESVARRLEPGSVPEGTQAFPGTRGTAVSLAEDPIDAYWNRPSAMPLTEAGARAIADFDGASTDNPRLRCAPTNILFDWTFETDVNRIVQDEHTITLLYGSFGFERTIHLNTLHPEDIIPTRAGHSIGRWENDVLIVDTSGFLPGILSADGRIPHSDRLHVVERFSLDPERRALVRRYVARDPEYIVGEYTGSDTVFLSDLPYQTTPCDDRSFKSPASAEIGEPPPWPVWALMGLAGALIVGWIAFGRSRRDRPAGDSAS